MREREGPKIVEEHGEPKNCHLNSDVLFYLRWQVCRGPQPRAVPLRPVPTGCVAHLKIRP